MRDRKLIEETVMRLDGEQKERRWRWIYNEATCTHSVLNYRFTDADDEDSYQNSELELEADRCSHSSVHR